MVAAAVAVALVELPQRVRRLKGIRRRVGVSASCLVTLASAIVTMVTRASPRYTDGQHPRGVYCIHL